MDNFLNLNSVSWGELFHCYFEGLPFNLTGGVREPIKLLG